jgi:hypothetical protein
MKTLRALIRVLSCFAVMMECAALEPSTVDFQIGGAQ